MSIRKYIIITLCFFCFAFTNSPIHASERLEPVTIQFKWFHQFQFAGYYAAVEKGFYAEEGLDVTLRERNPETDHIEDVLKDKAEYGVADAGLLLTRFQGKPVVLLAQIFQHSPLVFLALQRSGIRTPFDLKGKSVMIDNNYYKYPSLNALIIKTLDGIDKVTRIPETYRNHDLVDGKTDVMVAYITDQPFWFKEKGIDLNVIDPRDYGIDFYGDNLFTTEKEIREHPQRVAKMVRATIKGWRYALEHKDEIVDLILEKYNTQKFSREHLIYEAEETKKMIIPGFIDIGQFELSRFQKIVETYNNLGLTNLAKMDERFFYKEDTPQIRLNPDEQAWMEAHPKIWIGIMNAWPPMNYVDAQGNPKGIGVDYIKALNKRLNSALTIVPGPFKENFDLVKEKKLDALLDITPKKEREPFFNFTMPYLTIPHVIVGRHDGPSFKSEKDLAGKTIALEQGFYNVNYFRKNYPEVTVKEYGSTSEALDAVIRGEADAYAGNRAVVIYLIEQELMAPLEIRGLMDKPPVILSIGVRKDWPELVGILNKALAAIPEEEHQQIRRRWISLGAVEDQPFLELTVEQKAWLSAHPTITVAIDPMWHPVESVSNDGEYEGITRDYLDMIAKMLGVEFQALTDASWPEAVEKVKSGEADMFSAVMRTPERETYLSFTDSYLELPQVIFTRNDHPFIHDIRDLHHDERVCAIKGYAVTEFLQRDYPEIRLVEVNNIREALTLLTTGKAEAYVDALLTTAYFIAESSFANIKVAGEAPYHLKLCMAVRKELTPLVPILNKVLASITEEERHQILHRWRTIKHEVGFDYSLLWKVLLPIVLILVVVVYWNRRLSHEVAERKRAEQGTSMAASLLRATIESTTDGILVVDQQQKITSYNARFLDIWRLDRELVETADDKVLLDAVLILLEDPEAFLERVKHLYANPEKEDFTTLSLRDGRVLERYSKPQRLGDRIVGRVWSFRDVTARHQADTELHKLSRATEASPASIVITDSEGTIEYVNPKFVEVTGYTVEEAIGKNPTILKSGEQPAEFYKELWETITAGREWRGQIKNKKKNGELYWESASISPIRNAANEISHFVAVKQDITERKQAEEDLQRNYEALERFRRLAVEREIKMVKLKEEVNELLSQLGTNKKYKIVQL